MTNYREEEEEEFEPDEFEDDDEDDEEEEEEDDGDGDLEALIEEAEALVGEGEYLKAIKLWKRSLDRFSDEPAAYYHLAHAIHEFILAEQSTMDGDWTQDTKLMGLSEDAISALGEATVMDPEHHDSFALVGHLHALRGEKESAIENFERSLALNPGQKKIKKALDALKEDDE